MIIMTDERRPAEGASADPWADWKPQWTGAKTTPHDVQEKHSPTKAVAVRVTADRKQEQSQRRIVDARLWEQMTPPQQDAALEIAAAFEMMGRGLGYVTSNWARIPGCRGPSSATEIHGRMINMYVAWAEACAKRKISHSMVLDVLCYGHSCRAVDRDRRLKNGSARENLMKGLALYCELRGW